MTSQATIESAKARRSQDRPGPPLLMGSPVLLLSTIPGSERPKHLRRLIGTAEGTSGTPRVIQELTGNAEVLIGRDRVAGPISEETMSWVRAGDLLEKALDLMDRGERPDSVLFLDPWAALILSRGMDLFPGAKRIFISDLEERAARGERDYWRSTADWIRGLAIDQVIPVGELGIPAEPPGLSNVQPTRRGPSPSPRVALEDPFIPSYQPAWRWKGVSRNDPASKPTAGTASLQFLLLERGSLLHLRVALDALSRLEGAPEEVHVHLLSKDVAGERAKMVEVFRRVHPRLKLSVERLPETREAWDELGRRWIQGSPGSSLALADDLVIVPPDFRHRLLGNPEKPGGWVRFDRSMLRAEAADHILTGNLDPVPHYEKLLAASDTPELRDSRPALIFRSGNDLALPGFSESTWAFANSARAAHGRDLPSGGAILAFPEEP